MIYVIINILITFIVVIVFIEIRKWRIKEKLRYFESPKEYPIIGVAGRFFDKNYDQIIETILKCFNEVKTTPIQLWFGPMLVVGISEPQDIQIILTDENCLNKPYFYRQAHCKSSIIATDREIWKSNRRTLNATFNVEVLQSFVQILNNKSHILIDRVQSFIYKSDDLYSTIFICMTDMITRTIFGCEMNLQSERGAFFHNVVKQIMSCIQYRLSCFWFRWDFLYSVTSAYREEKFPLQDFNNFIDELYLKKISEIESLRSQGIDYLKIVRENNAVNFLDECLRLQNEGTLTDENVLDQIRAVILAGIDTSAITVFSTLLMLAIHQKHQDLVVLELQSVLESVDCDINQIHLSKLECLERTIKESMRLFPPIPFISRKTSDDVELNRGTIPKNTTIFVNINHLHRNPQIWGDNVDDFEPDRFLPENIAKRPPFSFIPFSAGSRNCIGNEYAMLSTKITLIHLLRRYKFTTHLHLNDIRLKLQLVLKIMNDKPIRFENRIIRI